MKQEIEQQKPTSEEWNTMMNCIKHYLGKPVVISMIFGEHMIDHFTNCMPPILWSDNHVLCSEPYDEDEQGSERYIGFYKKDNIYYGIITTIVNFNQLIKS